MAIPAPVWSLCQHFTTLAVKVFSLIMRISLFQFMPVASHPVPVCLWKETGHASCFASQHLRASRVPEMAEMATIPFGALFFPLEGSQGATASEGKEGRSTDEGVLLHRALWLQRPEPPAPDPAQAARE